MKPDRLGIAKWLVGAGLLREQEIPAFTSDRQLPESFRERVLARSPAAVPVDVATSVDSRRIISVEAFTSPEPPVLISGGSAPREFKFRRIPTYHVMLHDVADGKVFVGYARTTVILDKMRFFRGVSSPASEWIAPAFADAPPDLPLKGTVAILFADGASLYGHWMFDLLPKFEVLRRAGWTDRNIDHYVVNSNRGNFCTEIFSRLGIPREKIVYGAGSLISGDRLLIPSQIRRGFRTPRWALEFVVSLFHLSNPPATTREKIYISRAKAKKRRITNEIEVRTSLESRGFHTVYAEEMPVSEMAQLVRSSAQIVAPHGAGITNVAFAAPGVRVLELFGCHIIVEGWLMTSAVGGRHFLLAGLNESGHLAYDRADRSAAARSARNEADYLVDTGVLDDALDILGAP